MKLAEELRDYKNKQKDFKLAILVDNLVALEMVADKNGYGKEMKDFLMRFIVEDVYKRNT